MKWSIPQLRKLETPFKFDFELNLNEHLTLLTDVIKAEYCKVSGVCRELTHDTYQFTLNIDALLILECSVSLEDVPYYFDNTITETFGFITDYSSDINPILKDTIDLTDVVLSEIIVSKPMKVVKEGYEEYYSEEEVDKINPQFAGLKDLLGGNKE